MANNSSFDFRITRIDDSAVDDTLDRALRVLLSACFTKPQDSVFRDRRYFKEPPVWRWLMRDETGRLIGNIAVHDKTVMSGTEKIPIGGIAEVCVHPDFQRRGLAKEMLMSVHGWLASRGCDFAVLFGNPVVYASSGYREAGNVLHFEGDGANFKKIHPLVRELGSREWPSGEVRLYGPSF